MSDNWSNGVRVLAYTGMVTKLTWFWGFNPSSVTGGKAPLKPVRGGMHVREVAISETSARILVCVNGHEEDADKLWFAWVDLGVNYERLDHYETYLESQKPS